MDFFDAIYWGLVEETALRNPCKMSFEEKCSAAGLGLAYGLAMYEKKLGRQHLFLITCMEEAIVLSYKKNNRRKRIESDYSLDKGIIYEGSLLNGHGYFADRKVNIESIVLFHDFEDALLGSEVEIWKLMLDGLDLQEIAGYLNVPIHFVKDIASKIERKYKEYCI